MKNFQYVEIIKKKFGAIGVEQQIPLITRNKYFIASMVTEGIRVDNLGNNPVLVWEVFDSAIDLLIRNGVGIPVMKGSAMNNLLGDPGLPLDSIEGYVGQKVFQKQVGQVVFRRISPIVGILRWAGIARNGKGVLILQ
ncbi:hypothetical protein [Dyadobacter frigoris]|uniref:Uncharacterized protein n=1 Tax=Dyadobacter frigoris TaxID=2576211 RepID=A0A4U6D5R9_9BACT|nr:hypothetical protein [Dyadobacter frigoris]TKT91398.1 hypothetical protein FDK13_13560 [Dyadobacter frigoris]